MRKTAFLVLATLALTACGSSGSQAENAGMAMAETACLLFDDSVTFDQISDMTGTIMNEYGWEKPEDIDSYLSSIQGTDELETVKNTAASHMEDTCGTALADSGITAEELAESMVTTDTTTTEETPVTEEVTE